MGTGHRELAQLPDEVLAGRARDGSTVAFEELVRRYQQPMYALAVRMLGSAGDPDAVVQEAFVSAWRRLPSFRGEAAFGTWIYRIVVNRALTELRRHRVHAELPDDDRAPAIPATAGPEARVEVDALAAALAAALDRLPVDLRVAWLLREVDHRSYEEVAAIVGVNVSTVRGRLARGRTRLAELLEAWR